MNSGRDGATRRTFLKVAVAVGGVAGLSACLELEDDPDIPRGTDTPEELPTRQHAWNEFSKTDDQGNILPPRHHVLLFVNHPGEGPISESDREKAEQAFQFLERAYEWSSDGLLFTVGYSPSYFDRYDGSLPDSVDLPAPEALAPFEDPEFDTPDYVIHLASNHASVVMEAESVLFGQVKEANGLERTTDLTGISERVDRRTGFIGAGLPAANDDVAGIPEGAVAEDAPLFMGFKSGFRGNQPTEDSVTITDGPFAGGTTQHISRLRTHLNQWYEQDSRYQRVAKMFSPTHAEEDLVDGVGENLGTSSRITETGAADSVEDDAFQKGVVGHAQKTAQARDETGQPRILRRDFSTTDGNHTGVHFLSLQETITDFVETRKAMNGENVANVGGVGVKNNNGILQYITTLRRGNFLLPPRDSRAFPRPQ